MKQEDYIRVKMEMRLLDSGFYDHRLYKYINGEGRTQWNKDFYHLMWIKTDSCDKTSTGERPTIEANRVWWFKTVLHPELFNEDDK